MRLPATVTIADRVFAVKAKPSRKRAGGGSSQWAESRIDLLHDRSTSNVEMLDTLLHETVEQWAVGMGRYFTNGQAILITLDHSAVEQLAGTLAGIVRDMMLTNGVEFDPLAAYSVKQRSENNGPKAKDDAPAGAV